MPRWTISAPLGSPEIEGIYRIAELCREDIQVSSSMFEVDAVRPETTLEIDTGPYARPLSDEIWGFIQRWVRSQPVSYRAAFEQHARNLGLSNEIREEIIRRAVETQAGSASLLELARRMIPIQPLPQGALPVYDRELNPEIPDWCKQDAWVEKIGDRLRLTGQITQIERALGNISLRLWRTSEFLLMNTAQFLAEWKPCSKPTPARPWHERLDTTLDEDPV